MRVRLKFVNAIAIMMIVTFSFIDIPSAEASGKGSVAKALVGRLFPGAVEKRAVLAVAERNAATASQQVKSSVSAMRPRDVVIQRSRHPTAAQHIDDAQRQGQPTVLRIEREGASVRRIQSTGSVDRSRKPGPLYERDEYPPAFVREGGYNANVRYIPRSDNRGAGAVLGAQTRDLPNGSRIRILVSD